MPNNQDPLVDMRREAILRILKEVGNGLDPDQDAAPRFNSDYEGYAFIKREFDALWFAITTEMDDPNCDASAQAIRVAAYAVRFVLDLTG